MKSILLLGLLTLSHSAFSQSFLIMDNGLIITTDTQGYVYDIGDYAFPLKITLKGGQYFVEDGNVLATVDENGVLFRKYEIIPKNLLGKGGSYFLSAEGTLTSVDHLGHVHVNTLEAFKGATNFGGNFFTVQAAEGVDLYIVKRTGEAMKAQLPDELSMENVIAFGGSYFMTNRGVLYTVTDEGEVKSHADRRMGVLQRQGGNYFTDSTGLLYTVGANGELRLPGLPINLSVHSISKLGANYFLDLSGRLYTVDQEGNVWEKMLDDHDFKNARIISL